MSKSTPEERLARIEAAIARRRAVRFPRTYAALREQEENLRVIAAAERLAAAERRKIKA